MSTSSQGNECAKVERRAGAVMTKRLHVLVRVLACARRMKLHLLVFRVHTGLHGPVHDLPAERHVLSEYLGHLHQPNSH